MDKVQQSEPERLRQKAEELLNKKNLHSEERDAEFAKQKLIHELEVHQIELELQNDELMQAIDAEKRSSQKYQNLYDFAPTAYYTLSRDGRIEELNLMGAKMLGSERAYLKNKRFALFVSVNSKTAFSLFLDSIFQSNKAESSEIATISKDESKKYLYITGIASENREHCNLTAVDITEAKKTGLALIAAKERAERKEIELKAAQKITHIGSWYLDIATNQVVWSEELYKMYGFDPLLPVPPYTEHQKLFTAKSWALLSDSLAQTRETGIPYELELNTVRKDGSNGWMWVRGETVLDKKGCTIGLWGAAQDITERKNSEIELKIAKEKAEESDRLKSAFLANMSHEIRTPMNGILGFAELLKTPGLNGEKQQEYINIIEKAGDRMLNIINDIVSISKLESGLIDLNIRELNVNEQIEYIYSFFKPAIEAKKLSFSFENPLAFKDAVLNTDREKLFYILSNLVKNSIKFTTSGFIEIGYYLHHDKNGAKERTTLVFYVKDSGIGIPNDRQEAIFERFVQADIADKNAYQGAGLGLSISKAYVEMMGGRIWVISEEGIGSTFYFALPYAPKTEDEDIIEIVPPLEIAPFHRLNILIVEDDESSKELLEIAVGDFAKEMIIVGTGMEAVNTCQKNPDIDLVLMDIQLPEMDGYEVARRIRLFNKELIIIAQTAYALKGDKENAIAAGCNDYLAKPVKVEELKSMIKKYFQKE